MAKAKLAIKPTVQERGFVPFFGEIKQIVHIRRFILICITEHYKSTWHIFTGPAYLLGTALFKEFMSINNLNESEADISVVGGGTFDVDSDRNIVTISGVSKEYGPIADNHFPHVEDILKEYFPSSVWKINRKKHTLATRPVSK